MINDITDVPGQRITIDCSVVDTANDHKAGSHSVSNRSALACAVDLNGNRLEDLTQSVDTIIVINAVVFISRCCTVFQNLRVRQKCDRVDRNTCRFSRTGSIGGQCFNFVSSPLTITDQVIIGIGICGLTVT